MSELLRYTCRTAVVVVGGSLLLVGAILLLMPGPGMLTIAAGLAVLAIEFQWAREMLQQIKRKLLPDRFRASAAAGRRGNG